MDYLFERIVRYLSRLGIKCEKYGSLPLDGRVPLEIVDSYVAYQATLRGQRHVFVLPRRGNPAPQDVRRCFQLLLKFIPDGQIAFSFREVDAEYDRVLRAAEIPFVVPGRILHLPPLGELVSDNAFSAEERLLGRKISPWAQVVLFWHMLFNRGHDECPFAVLKERLKINSVYLTRASRELERRSLMSVVHRAGEGVIIFPCSARELWRRAFPNLSSPVRRVVRVIGPAEGFICHPAGTTALSECSMLTADRVRTYAVKSARLAEIPQMDIRRYEGDFIQGWKYDPALLAGARGAVDPLSLYLSLSSSPDPRVQGALEELLEKTLW